MAFSYKKFLPVLVFFMAAALASVGCQFATRLINATPAADVPLTSGQQIEITPGSSLNHKLTFQGQIGGSSYAVDVQGNFAYLGVGPRVYVLDVSDSSAPKLIGQSGVLPGVVQSVIAASDYVYVAAGKGYLRVLDVSTPTQPVEAAALVENSHAQSLALDGTTLYIADNPYGLRVADVSDPLHPRKISEVKIPGAAMSIDVNESRAFIAGSTSENGLVIVDISNPARPVKTAAIAIPEAEGSVVYAVKVSGNYAYVAIGSRGMVVVDIANPEQPMRAGEFFTAWADGLVMEGNTLYLADQVNGLYALDISNPKNPTQVGLLPLDLFQQEVPSQRNMVVENGRIFFANGNQGMLIADASLQPDLTGKFDTPLPGADWDVVVDNNTAYVIADTLGLYSIDVSNSAQPRQLDFDTSRIHNGLRTPRGIAIYGSYAYIADVNDGFSVYDISDPSNLIELSRVEKPQGMTDVAVFGNFAYVSMQQHAQRENRGMLIYDVSNPAQPVQVGFVNTDHSANAVAAQGNFAYLPEMIEMVEKGQPADLFVFDISNPASPIEAGKADTSLNALATTCIEVAGNYAYIGDQTTGLHIFDVSNPAAPVEVGALPDIMLVLDLTVSGDMVFTANHGFVGAVDVSDPANPTLEDMYASSGWSWGVDAVGSTIYVADYDGGLALLSYEK